MRHTYKNVKYLSGLDDPHKPSSGQLILMDGVVQLGDDGISFGNLLRRIIHGVDGISPKLHAHFANGSILDTVADLR